MAYDTAAPSAPSNLRLPVIESRGVGLDFVSLTLEAPPELRCMPGQFLNVQTMASWDEVAACCGHTVEAGEGWPRLKGPEAAAPMPLVRRPLSIARLWQGGAGQRRLELLFRVVGKGTRLLASARPGQTIDAVGPLGNHFTILPAKSRAMLVAGGCGIAPLTALAEDLRDARKDVVCVLGCETLANMPASLSEPVLPQAGALKATGAVKEFGQFGFQTFLSTDDGSAGYRGPATEVLERCLENMPQPFDDLAIYCCGPAPMMKRVAQMTTELGIFCELSLEEYMGCGIGVCLSCACKVRDAAKPRGWTYRLTCTDGPILQADDIIWE